MNAKLPNLVEIHHLSLGNELLIQSAGKVGCFDQCLSIFPATLIEDWIDDEPHRTALCPTCGFDTIIPEHESYVLSRDLLAAMNARYMAPTHDDLS
jgi:hypothetical protein